MPYLYIVDNNNEPLNCFTIKVLYSSALCFKARIKLLAHCNKRVIGEQFVNEGLRLKCVFNKETEYTLLKSRGLEAILMQILGL